MVNRSAIGSHCQTYKGLSISAELGTIIEVYTSIPIICMYVFFLGDMDPCGHMTPCLHGGNCTNTGPDTYLCTCADNHMGVNCQDNSTTTYTCNLGTCLNEGTCMVSAVVQCNCMLRHYQLI